VDFKFSEEQQLLRQTVRRYTQENLIPLEDELRGRNFVRSPESDPINNRLRDKAKEIGLFNLNVPKEFGGLEMSSTSQTVVDEEVGRAFLPEGISTGIRSGIPGILYKPSILENPKLKAEIFDPVLRGEAGCGFLQTEPQSGSDPAAIQCFAEDKGDHWLINGDKGPVGGGSGKPSEFYHLLATTNRDARRSAIKSFIVSSDRPGFEYVRNIPLVGGILQVCQISFHDYVLPKEYMVEEEGFAAAQMSLGRGRQGYNIPPGVSQGPQIVAKCERGVEMAIAWAKQRITFGQPIASRQAIQWMLADSAIDIEAMRWMCYKVAWMTDEGQPTQHIGAMQKTFCVERGHAVMSRTMQIFGAAGMSDDLPIARYWVDTRHRWIGHGSVEMMRFIISRNMLRD
jgi:acyl-CoA dehydrogenase